MHLPISSLLFLNVMNANSMHMMDVMVVMTVVKTEMISRLLTTKAETIKTTDDSSSTMTTRILIGKTDCSKPATYG
jgi:hypothetical protein